MKKVSIFFCGPLYPLHGGNQKVVIELLKYLHSSCGVVLTLVLAAEHDEQYDYLYKEICDYVVWLKPYSCRSWYKYGTSIVSRLGIDLLINFVSCLYYRHYLKDIVCSSDVVILNYASWGFLIPQAVRRKKCFVVTHDIMFYRRASFNRSNSILSKLNYWLNKKFEIDFLQTFWKVGVLADYERKLLLEENISDDQIVEIGMPISAENNSKIDTAKEKLYDFVYVGGGSYQNYEGLKCFLRRVVPLLSPRKIKIGVVSNPHPLANKEIPENVAIKYLGRVENLRTVFDQSVVGIGTLTVGSGIKVKVVESLMSGLPMVLTDKGAEGIPTTPCGVLNIDHTDSDTIKLKLLDWLDNNEQACRDGEAESIYVSARFKPEVTLKQFGEVVKGA